MATDMNVVAVVGRLVRESEIRYSQAGGAVCRFSIAVNRRKRNGDRWEDEANFFDCVYFGKAAEAVNQYLVKGRQVSISGELHQSRWTDQDGQAHNRVEIFVNNLSLIGGSNGNAQSNGSSYNDGGSANYNQRPTTDRNQSPARPQREAIKQAPLDSFAGQGPESYSDDDDNVPF